MNVKKGTAKIDGHWVDAVSASDYDALASVCRELIATGINVEAILADEPTGKYIHPQLWEGLKSHRDGLRKVMALLLNENISENAKPIDTSFLNDLFEKLKNKSKELQERMIG